MREEVAYNPVWACVGHDTFIEVLPGETRADTLTLWGPNAFDDKTGEPFGVLEGRMQIGYQAKSCADQFDPCELPQEATTSNLFTVTLPD
jgi:hypothetical protein